MAKKDKPDLFLHQSMQDRETIEAYLEALGDGFQSGKLMLAAGEHDMELTPQGLLDFSVKARRKDGQVRVSIKIQWKERHDSQAATRPLRISPQTCRDD